MAPLVESFEPLRIKKVAVLGAGSTGVGIAAHLANLKFEVALFDTSAERAESGIAKALQAKRSLFYLPELAETVRCASIADDLGLLQDVDWVCEAVTEDPSEKQTILATIGQVVPSHAVVTTSTALCDVAELSAGLKESLRLRFAGAHFLPYPRYSKLLELTAPPYADRELVLRLSRFFEDCVGRRVVPTKGTPGLIAGRLAVWEIFHAIHVAEKLRLDLEVVDAVTAAISGTPGRGVTRLADSLGLDYLANLAAGIAQRTTDDAGRGILQPPASIAALLERGCLGDKVGRGINRSEGSDTLVVDLVTLAYRQYREPEAATVSELSKLPFGERLRWGLGLRDEVGEFLRNHYLPYLRYVERLQDQIADNPCDIDRAVVWALGRSCGPVALLAASGVESSSAPGAAAISAASAKGDTSDALFVGEAEARYRSLDEYSAEFVGEHYEIRDLGDSVRALAIRPLEGCLSLAAVEEIHSLLDRGVLGRFVLALPRKERAYTYDLPFILDRIAVGDVLAIETYVRRMQELNARFAALPCVAALEGTCTGAFFEAAMHCPDVVADPELNAGLTQSLAGLIPAGGGLTAMRFRTQEAGPKAIAEAAALLLTGAKSTCALDAARRSLLRPTDHIVRHPDRVLWEAKESARVVEPKPMPAWGASGGPLPGMLDRRRDELKARGGLSTHDETIAEKIKQVLARAHSAEEALAFERRGFLELCSRAMSQARMRHLVAHGTPLRN